MIEYLQIDEGTKEKVNSKVFFADVTAVAGITYPIAELTIENLPQGYVPKNGDRVAVLFRVKVTFPCNFYINSGTIGKKAYLNPYGINGGSTLEEAMLEVKRTVNVGTCILFYYDGDSWRGLTTNHELYTTVCDDSIYIEEKTDKDMYGVSSGTSSCAGDYKGCGGLASEDYMSGTIDVSCDSNATLLGLVGWYGTHSLVIYSSYFHNCTITNGKIKYQMHVGLYNDTRNALDASYSGTQKFYIGWLRNYMK